ncbi:uncharacterized protein LOC111318838 [Stylophora pistillata]|uniref:uncharacterized protein LOC111318838 n=1 Tax=Stylophora pistillata TaxID=50429 RepID=UPI000C049108|nr:uncharacterized protein LOC111318838 [Stylophora pistillata]
MDARRKFEDKEKSIRIAQGTGGLLTAYTLLSKKKETNICIFEREDHPGGRILNFSFVKVPDVAVGLGQWNIYGGNYDESGIGPNGEVVLHTTANNGGCSDKWGQILQISKKTIDEELTRYKYRLFQKPGTNFDLITIRQWAKRPLTGQDVFLVDRAFNNFGGWLQDTLRSANDALVEGWNVTLPFQLNR